MSKKFKELAYIHSKELKIPNDIWERFNDLSKPHITFQDSLDSALVVSAKLGNQGNYDFIKSIMEVEDSLKDNPLFKQGSELSEQIKKQFDPPQNTKDYVKNQQEATEKLYKLNKPLIDSMNEVRNKTLKNLPNPTSIVPTFEKVNQILNEGVIEAQARSELHRHKAEKLKIVLKEIDDEVVLLERKEDLDRHSKRVIELMGIIGIVDSSYITQHSRGMYKEMKKMEVPTSPKYNQKYPKETTDRVIKGLKNYWEDDLPFDKNEKFLHNRQTWFNKLADENNISFKRVEQIEVDNRPADFSSKRTKN